MTPSNTHRLASFAIAFVMTLATLGGIDGLAQQSPADHTLLAAQPAVQKG